MRPAYKYPAIAFAALLLLVFFLFLLISGDLAEKILRAELTQRAGVSFDSNDFTKTFPLGFKARGVRLFDVRVKGEEGFLEIAYIDEISVSLAILPLIFNEKKFSFLATLGDGTIEGDVIITEDARVEVRVKDVALGAFSQLRELGFEGGKVSAAASFTSLSGQALCPEGRVNLDAYDVDLKGLKSKFPLMLFGETLSASLAMEIKKDCMAEVLGLFIEGDAISAKLDGSLSFKSPVSRSTLDTKVEIFVKPGARDLAAENVLLSMMKEYKRPSGSYLFTLKGRILDPSIKKVGR